MTNPWDKRYTRGEFETRQTRKVLILCEDEKTAPHYFRKFPIEPQDVLVEVAGTGMNTNSLVEEAVRRKDHGEAIGERYIAVWCVFDRNSFPTQNFNEAFAVARRNNIKIAYANQCFELWYWLHFDLQQTAVSRADYGDKLSLRLQRKYHKTDTSLYEELKPRQSDALRNAKKLLSFYVVPNPAEDDPSTTIHLLVEFLNGFTS